MHVKNTASSHIFLVVTLALSVEVAAASNASSLQNATVQLSVHDNTTRSLSYLRGRKLAEHVLLGSDSLSGSALGDFVEDWRPGGGSHGAGQRTHGQQDEGDLVRPTLTRNAFLYSGVGIMAVLTGLILLTLCEKSGQHGAAYRTFEDDVESSGHGEDRVWTESIDALIERMGLSALCLADLDTVTLSGFKRWTTMPVLAAQCWAIQGGLLYYLTSELRSWPEGYQRDLPAPMLLLAMYLHTVVVLGDMALSLTIFSQLRNICTNAEQYWFVIPMYFMDAFVVPASSLVIGTLYLVTSRTVSDVILNSCALTFISNIDNWILGAMHAMNTLAGTTKDFTLVLPINPEFMYYINNGLVVFPVLPAFFSMYMLYVGQELLHL